MLTVKEVALRLNVSVGLVYKLVASGALQAHRIGSAIRVTEAQVNSYLDHCGSTTPRQPPTRVDLKHLDL
jgi:excisionase family DNA binding protein